MDFTNRPKNAASDARFEDGHDGRSLWVNSAIIVVLQRTHVRKIEHSGSRRRYLTNICNVGPKPIKDLALVRRARHIAIGDAH